MNHHFNGRFLLAYLASEIWYQIGHYGAIPSKIECQTSWIDGSYIIHSISSLLSPEDILHFGLLYLADVNEDEYILFWK